MKIEKAQNTRRERQILLGMILDADFLSRVCPRWGHDSLSSKYACLIGGLCVDYYKRHKKAPGRNIVPLVADRLSGSEDGDTVRQADALLRCLDREDVQGLHTSYLIDLAGEHLNRVRLSNALSEAQEKLDANDVAGAEALLTNYSRVEMGVGAGVDLFLDEEAVRSTFSHEEGSEELFSYPGDLGDFFSGNESLCRDSFIAFLAPMKTGKTFWLIDMAWRCMLSRRRVAFFEVGDLSEKQLKARFLSRATGEPYRAKQWPARLNIPTTISPPDKGEYTAHVTHKEKVFKKPLSADDAWERCKAIQEERVKSKKSYFRHSVHPNFSISAGEIQEVLRSWAREGWVADALFIDYADLLTPSPGTWRHDKRDQVNTTWMQLRAMSMEFHCLLVTATQANREAFDKPLMRRSCVGEDVRKLAHTTGVVGINVLTSDKERGLSRLQWVSLREGEFSQDRVVHVAGCLGVANPAMLSTY